MHDDGALSHARAAAPGSATSESANPSPTAISPAGPCRSPVSAAGPVQVPPLSAVEFVSAQQGWAVGAGRILATSDGGRAWLTQYRGAAKLDQVDFVDAEHGWAGGTSDLLATPHAAPVCPAPPRPFPPLRPLP